MDRPSRILKPLAVLRPEPGNAGTATRVAAAGGRAVRLPLFEVVPLLWTPPAVGEHDALLLTSANAVRHAGRDLALYRDLPVFAVGEPTAAAARSAGLAVVTTGKGGVAALTGPMMRAGVCRALHLTGRDRVARESPAISRTIAVYASDARRLAASDLLPLAQTVALVHSARAGERLAELVVDRSVIAIAAISPAAAAAAGTGWAAIGVASTPTDAALIAAGLMLAD